MSLHHIAVGVVAGALLAAGGSVAAHLIGQEDPPAQKEQQPPKDTGGFPDLVGGLKATPGCLGVETASTSSGKQVIFAWFENKAAVKRWYYSDMHQDVMERFFAASASDHEPMQGVPDDVPIMAIASITFADQPRFEDTALPISQIAIELYTPVTGGIWLGGRFAPEGLKVKNLVNVGGE